MPDAMDDTYILASVDGLISRSRSSYYSDIWVMSQFSMSILISLSNGMIEALKLLCRHLSGSRAIIYACFYRGKRYGKKAAVNYLYMRYFRLMIADAYTDRAFLRRNHFEILDVLF